MKGFSMMATIHEAATAPLFISSLGGGVMFIFAGQSVSGSFIQGIPFWYSDSSPMSATVTLDLVPMSARFLSVGIQAHSDLTSDLVLISLTLFPTNSKKATESFCSIPRTAVESVKNLVFTNLSLSESLIFIASRTDKTAPINSSLGTEILFFGATRVLPAISRQATDPSSSSHRA